MKKFAELDVVQNLTWRQVITYSTLTLTTLIAATWTIATRVADSKAEYVNMRYAEIETLQNQLVELQKENEQYRKLDSKNKNVAQSASESEIKELVESESYFDPKSGLFVSISELSNSGYAYFSLNFPDGSREYVNGAKTGYGKTFEHKGKKYQFVLAGVKDKKAKITVREL